jgi:hypothetical protein
MESKNVMSWVTGSEVNNDYFTLERSTDGEFFDEIAEVQGAGNSSTEITYNEEDYTEIETVVYYRLKQTDFDGTYSYSKVISIEASDGNSFSSALSANVYPNPLGGNRCYVDIFQDNPLEREVLLILVDPMGREIFSKMIVTSKGETTVAIDLKGNIAPGVYVVKVSSDNELFQKKLVVR